MTDLIITQDSLVLIVDDDKLNGLLLKKRLEKKSIACDFVMNHEEAFRALEEKDYDLILLDIMMPEVSGIEILEKIRKEKNNFELPVIMVTSKDEASDVVDALKKGANDYITKPVNMEVAIARIKTQLGIKSLVEEGFKNKQISTINKMVTTLNHEINNPLAIAVGLLGLPKDKITDERIDKALGALERITEIVKKIEKISNGDMEEVEYSSETMMYKI